MDSQSESKVIADIAKEIGATMVILSHTTNGKATYWALRYKTGC